MKAAIQLLRAIRKASGYASFHAWEPATDFDENNSNFPFKPQTGFDDVGLKTTEEISRRADGWDGGLSDWNHALKAARVGHVIDFYVTKVGEELVTNIEVWIDSETHAYWSDCGGKTQEVSIVLGGAK